MRFLNIFSKERKEKLDNGLEKTKKSFLDKLSHAVVGKSTIDDDVLDSLEEKAVNSGGVATSGLEMTQNAEHISWTGEEVDRKLHHIMAAVHEQCVKYGKNENGYIDYVRGANIAGFMKVAKAMLAQGII